MIKLNLGCGKQVVNGWINVDYSLGARLLKFRIVRFLNKKFNFFKLNWDKRIFIHNLLKTFPWSNNSLDVIYSSHTLEHFSKTEGRFLLSESYRVLKYGGIIRIIVPDLKTPINEYVSGNLKADDFINRLGVLYHKSDNPIKNLIMPLMQFPHKCWYDNQSLIDLFNDLGFETKIMKPFESKIDCIQSIELKDRTINSVIIEGVKKHKL